MVGLLTGQRFFDQLIDRIIVRYFLDYRVNSKCSVMTCKCFRCIQDWPGLQAKTKMKIQIIKTLPTAE